jgi:hypothetical protein
VSGCVGAAGTDWNPSLLVEAPHVDLTQLSLCCGQHNNAAQPAVRDMSRSATDQGLHGAPVGFITSACLCWDVFVLLCHDDAISAPHIKDGRLFVGSNQSQAREPGRIHSVAAEVRQLITMARQTPYFTSDDDMDELREAWGGHGMIRSVDSIVRTPTTFLPQRLIRFASPQSVR